MATAPRVGPTAWMVLTALALRAQPTSEHLIARASARSLAAEIGLNKDTVARALARVRQAGLVVHSIGPFEIGVYRMTVPPHVVRVVREHFELAPRRRSLPAASNRQLTLLEAE